MARSAASSAPPRRGADPGGSSARVARGSCVTPPAAVDGVDEERRVEEAVGIGKDWKGALGAVDWHGAELLVIGSSSEGRRSRVFLGSNAARIIRHSPVPVLVVP